MERYLNRSTKNVLTTSLALICLLLFTQSHAGFISALGKAVRSADAPSTSGLKHADLDLKQLDLPFEKGTTPELLNAKLDANGEWRLKRADGTDVSATDTLDNSAIVIDGADIPQQFHAFDALPQNTPIVIRHKNSAYKLAGKPNWSLYAGKAAVPVNTQAGLKQALFHFNRDWKGGPVRVVGLSQQATHSLELPRGVKTNTLLHAPHQLNGQTIVLSGPIKDGKIKVAGQRYSLKELESLSAEHDFSLVVLESSTITSPKAVANHLDKVFPEGRPKTTGEFLSGISANENQQTFYGLTDMSQRQTLISLKPSDNPHTSFRWEDLGVELGTHIALRSLRIYQTSEARQAEIDKANKKPASWIDWFGIYLIFSSIAGFAAFGSCREFLRRWWPTRTKPSFGHVIHYYGFKGARLLLLLNVVLPFFGLPIAIYNVITTIIIVIKIIFWPFIWVFKKLSSR